MPTPRTALTARWLVVAAALVPLLAAALLTYRPAVATEGMMRAARTAYPAIVNTRLDTCDLCHTGTNYAVNSYGRDYNQNRRNFKAIEGLDSDGDGFTNLVEIQALTFPGRADDFPAVTPTPTGGATATATATATLVATATVTQAPPTETITLPPTRPPTATPTASPGEPRYRLHLPYLLRKK